MNPRAPREKSATASQEEHKLRSELGRIRARVSQLEQELAKARTQQQPQVYTHNPYAPVDTHQIRTGPARSDKARTLPNHGAPVLQRQLALVMGRSEAASTRNRRDNLFARFRTWTASRQMEPTEYAAMLFTLATKTKASSKQTYFGNLLARIAPPTQLQMFRRGLRRLANAEPIEQAVPATWNDVEAAMQRLPTHRAAVLYLMWKTASRFDEIERLTRQQCIVVNNNDIVIAWGTDTKTSADQPFRKQFYVEVIPH